MKEGLIAVEIAFLLTVMVFAGLVNHAFALSDYKSDWSNDGTAQSEATGSYAQIGDPYSVQAHRGKIEEGNVQRYAFTKFTQENLARQTVAEPETFQLQNHTSKYKSYSYANVYFIRTETDSGYGSIPESRITVEIGPPGVE